jgi:predicted nucleic acid-binding protein
MTGLCFVDANVLVYARDPRDPVKQQRAIEWIDMLWSERRGRLSAQVISEAYVVLKRLRKESPEQLWARLEGYFTWNPVAVDERILRRARELEHRYQISWWDSLIVAAAQVQECRTLLTEDLHDGATFGMLRVRNPFLHAVEEPAAHYALPAVRPLHRPRGRPKRLAT